MGHIRRGAFTGADSEGLDFSPLLLGNFEEINATLKKLDKNYNSL